MQRLSLTFPPFPSPRRAAAVANMDQHGDNHPRTMSLGARPATGAARLGGSGSVRLYTCAGAWLKTEDVDGQMAQRLYFLPNYHQPSRTLKLLGFSNVSSTGAVTEAELDIPLPAADAICREGSVVLVVRWLKECLALSSRGCPFFFFAFSFTYSTPPPPPSFSPPPCQDSDQGTYRLHADSEHQAAAAADAWVSVASLCYVPDESGDATRLPPIVRLNELLVAPGMTADALGQVLRSDMDAGALHTLQDSEARGREWLARNPAPARVSHNPGTAKARGQPQASAHGLPPLDENAEVAKSGWLTKEAEHRGKARRRYFVLAGHRVNYFAGSGAKGEGHKLKGSFMVQASARVTCEGGKVTVKNPDRSWGLVAGSGEEAQAWAGAFDRARQAAAAAAAATGTLPDGDDESMAGDHRTLVEAEVNLSLEGGVWLDKRGTGMGKLTGDKHRYFVMVYGCQSGSLRLNYYGALEEDVPRDKKGFIEIFPSAEPTYDDRTIRLPLPGRTWQLRAATPEEARIVVGRWKQVLSDVRVAHERTGVDGEATPLPFAVRLYQLCGGSVDVTVGEVHEALEREYHAEVIARHEAQIARTVEHANLFRLHDEPVVSGWFVKEAQGFGSDHKRWFELLDNTVRYYVSCNENKRGVNPKGSMDITSRTLISQHRKSLIIQNPERTMNLTAVNVEQAQDWATALEHAKEDATMEEAASNALANKHGGRGKVHKVWSAWAVGLGLGLGGGRRGLRR